MWIDTSEARLPLHAGQMARIRLAPRTRLSGVAGQAWITFDNDRRDIVLGPGETFVTEAATDALACALRGGGDAELLVVAAPAASAAGQPAGLGFSMPWQAAR